MNNFITLLTQTQQEIKANLTKYIKSKGYTNIIDTEDAVAFISPKENQPLLVAHLDTINSKRAGNSSNTTYYGYYGGVGGETEQEDTPQAEDILVTDKYILLSPEHNSDIYCLGADDRVGVKTILDMLDKGNIPHILFTTDEESGCIGSRALINDPSFDVLNEATMLIQVDRGVHEGKWNEMVFYSYDHNSVPSIYEELSKYYSLATGSYTDVAVLGPKYNKPIVNLSASYKNEHGTDEFINLEAYKNNTESLDKFIKWAEKQDTTSWVYTSKPVPKVVKPSYTANSPFILKAKRDERKSKPATTIAGMLNDIDNRYGVGKKVGEYYELYKDYVEAYDETNTEYVDLFITELYKEGIVVYSAFSLEKLFDGTYYYNHFEEPTEAERKLIEKEVLDDIMLKEDVDLLTYE